MAWLIFDLGANMIQWGEGGIGSQMILEKLDIYMKKKPLFHIILKSNSKYEQNIKADTGKFLTGKMFMFLE